MNGRRACYPRRLGPGSRRRETVLNLIFSALGGSYIATGLLFPFFTALGLALALRVAGLRGVAGIAMPLTLFLAQGFATLVWLPPWGPPDSRAFYLALAGGAIGAALDGTRAPAMARHAVLVLWAGLIVAVLAGRRLTTERAEDPLLLCLLWLAGVAVLVRLEQTRRCDADAPLLLAVASAFAAMTAIAWSITTFVVPFAALGAACLAFAVLSFGAPPRPFGTAAVLAGGGAWFGFMAACLLHAGLPRWSFLLLLLPFAADLAWRRPAAGGMRWMRAAAIGAVAAVPGAVAVWHASP